MEDLKRFRVHILKSFSGGGLSFANVSSYSLLAKFEGRDFRKQVAFTLAEVLITLGIIGVVAAITIPSLIANYQKKVWVTQLKKDVNIAQNSIKKFLASEEVEKIEHSSLVEYLGDTAHNGTMSVDYHFDKLPLNKIKTAKTNFVSVDEGYGDDAKERDMTFLADGSCLLLPGTLPGWHFQWDNNNTKNNTFNFLVDVNCSKGPNEPGKDQFRFELDSYGKLIVNNVDDEVTQDEVDGINAICQKYPEACKEEFGSSTVDKDSLNAYNKKGSVEACTRGQLGHCFDLVVRDGWEIKYY